MKYAALVLSALALLLLGWGLYGVLQLVDSRSPTVRPLMMELAPMPPSVLAEQAKVADALEAMRRMAIGSETVRASTPGELLTIPAPGTPQVGSVQMPQRSMSLHIENLQAGTESVVIDNVLVQRGDRLTAGGLVARVRSNEATVSEKQGKQTLVLPLQDMKVGTLRWADGTPAGISTKEFKPGLPGSMPTAVRTLP